MCTLFLCRFNETIILLKEARKKFDVVVYKMFACLQKVLFSRTTFFVIGSIVYIVDILRDFEKKCNK